MERECSSDGLAVAADLKAVGESLKIDLLI
jgi:hypothetical protein